MTEPHQKPTWSTVRLHPSPFCSGNGPEGREENVNELYEQQRGATFTDQRKAIQCYLFNGSALYSESKYFCLNGGDKEAAGRPWGPSGHNLKSWMKIPRNHRMALKGGFL